MCREPSVISETMCGAPFALTYKILLGLGSNDCILPVIGCFHLNVISDVLSIVYINSYCSGTYNCVSECQFMCPPIPRSNTRLPGCPINQRRLDPTGAAICRRSRSQASDRRPGTWRGRGRERGQADAAAQKSHRPI